MLRHTHVCCGVSQPRFKVLRRTLQKEIHISIRHWPHPGTGLTPALASPRHWPHPGTGLNRSNYLPLSISCSARRQYTCNGMLRLLRTYVYTCSDKHVYTCSDTEATHATLFTYSTAFFRVRVSVHYPNPSTAFYVNIDF